jgi:hypothetical protein
MNQQPQTGHPAPTPSPSAPAPSKIQHSHSGFGQAGATGHSASPPPAAVPPAHEPLPVAPTDAAAMAPRIRALEKTQRHEETWSRTPNTTGQGAIHVKTFHCKLTDDALRYMDQTINEWLDAHPQYEVKFVNSTVGILTGKLKEPALICQVWV